MAAQPGRVCVSAELSQRYCCAVGHRITAATRGEVPLPASFTGSQQPTVEDLFASRFGTTTFGHRRDTSATDAPPPASPSAGVDALFTERFPALTAQATAERMHEVAASHVTTKTQSAMWGGLRRCFKFRGRLPSARINNSMGDRPSPAQPPARFSSQYPPVANEASGLSASRHQPPPPEVQRYWHSYQLWVSLRPHIQQEQQAVLQLRAQAHAAKIAQQKSLRQHLHRTMYWTLFVVCPLLGLLFLWLAIDAAAYGAELELLPFVKYDEALRDFAEAEGRHRQFIRGKSNNGVAKKKNIRID
ncbi:hypothetical protein, conserved [Leishmania donovani]|uniref:Transmembrane protein n=1 Tax=Leishmania donovani TaxID=5661 RepID=E9B7P3_LEIDO|nr:hypothetical protein, conserved [Leishmania donovani]TPP53980.1 hypothetical protein CGC21_23145 [Leishmania donovani]CBZ31266.1 hypothetical protein, conserved [Leishmania donovani]